MCAKNAPRIIWGTFSRILRVYYDQEFGRFSANFRVSLGESRKSESPVFTGLCVFLVGGPSGTRTPDTLIKSHTSIPIAKGFDGVFVYCVYITGIDAYNRSMAFRRASTSGCV